MSTSLTSQQRRGLRIGGYFALVIASLSSLHWLSVIYQDYVMEHRWPAASGVITSRREESREVQPASIRQHRYWFYRAEFEVVLDLPPDRCPGEVRVLNAQPAQCIATVVSPETRSRANAIQWLAHHPLDSTMTVHYDLATSRTFAGGESIIDLYPWYDIRITAIAMTVGLLMLAIGRKQPPISEDSESANTSTSLSIE